MATVILVRHGRSTANATGTLAGRLPGVALDDVGREQAERVGRRLAGVSLASLVSSPLERCQQTAKAIAAAHASPPQVGRERGINECDYGEWQGRTLKELAKEKLWKVVQAQPSAAAFPGGESLSAMQARAVDAVRRHDAAVAAEHGRGAVWAAVSHGDIVKALLADALGMHLDLFQRIHVDPGSVSIVHYGESRPYVLAMNTHEGDLGWLGRPGGRRRRPRGDAAVGGGAGPTPRP